MRTRKVFLCFYGPPWFVVVSYHLKFDSMLMPTIATSTLLYSSFTSSITITFVTLPYTSPLYRSIDVTKLSKRYFLKASLISPPLHVFANAKYALHLASKQYIKYLFHLWFEGTSRPTCLRFFTVSSGSLLYIMCGLSFGPSQA